MNSLSYYSPLCPRRSLIFFALEDFSKKNDILCLQETNLAPFEKQALSGMKGCDISRNNFKSNQAGTLIIDTPNIKKYFCGRDIPLPSNTKGYIQLRRYTPHDPSRSPFQIFNFYLKSGGEFSFNAELIRSLLGIDHGVPTFLCGDLNFVEKLSDTSSLTPRLPTKEFLSVWEKFLEKFDLSELPHDTHTHFHITNDPTSVYSVTSRLDRFFVPSPLTSHPLISPSVNIPFHHTNYSPSNKLGSKNFFSDHLPIKLSFSSDSPSSPGRPTIPRWLAESSLFEKTLREKWENKETTCPFVTLEKFKETLFYAAKKARRKKIESESAPLLLSQHLTLLRLILSPLQDLDRIAHILSLRYSSEGAEKDRGG